MQGFVIVATGSKKVKFLNVLTWGMIFAALEFSLTNFRDYSAQVKAVKFAVCCGIQPSSKDLSELLTSLPPLMPHNVFDLIKTLEKLDTQE